ncbi:MAG: hypothetical protein ACM3UV_05220, partial [Nocardioidaceae bacterium]
MGGRARSSSCSSRSSAERAQRKRGHGEQQRVAGRHQSQRGGALRDHVPVAVGELDEGEQRRDGHRGRERVHPPAERERAKRRHPDQELRRQHLPERREGRHGGEGGEHQRACVVGGACVVGSARGGRRQQREDGEQRDPEAGRDRR